MRNTKGILEAKVNPKVTFEIVDGVVRKRNYGVLSTVSGDGRPHSVGVLYAVSARGNPFSLYIVTDLRSKKARNITRNPNVSFVVPLPRRLGFLPPSTVQFQGTAEILPLADDKAREAFNASMILRRVLKLQLAQKGDVSLFIRVRPGSTVFTYGVGMSILELMKHVERAASRVQVSSSKSSERP